jgi:hypothetical protein
MSNISWLGMITGDLRDIGGDKANNIDTAISLPISIGVL